MKSDPNFVWSFTDYNKQATFIDYLYDSTAAYLWSRDTLKKKEIYKVDWFTDIPTINIKKISHYEKINGKSVAIYGNWKEQVGLFEKISTFYRKHYDEYNADKPFNWEG